MSIFKIFFEEAIKPSFEELNEIIKDSNQELKQLALDYNDLSDIEKKEVKLRAKEEFKDVFEQIRQDSKELKKDFNQMVEDVNESLSENNDICEKEKKEIIKLIKLTNPEKITNKLITYNNKPLKILEDGVANVFNELETMNKSILK